MALLSIVTVSGINKGKYEALRKDVRWETNPPDGLYFHSAGFDNAGIHVVDVWESPAAMDAFFGGRLGPGLQKIGVTQKPVIEAFPLHNANVFAGLQQFRVKQPV